ncbi:DUF2155 domain-containing protein [Sulfitobacter mediterraneus]|uniref:DUF2155 domain-containing protein n=1 Tax=Sulfitobacter mediterraneus TaxID=83219 RepID=UPI001931B8B8|nr:DUF2155 domain-containing protein [Sulfitobacter mediterraneus]MBM1631721.1 DUF2155 domain-containing protein [Sulfitobacter mediterraneus]MBM1639536.1 DUF2155 domain-containing protein [Sulfitobacter mediterraneus]MBM1643585.1 DUF2155 domain-containing protein [Sulfitobacter mediterraneus]MBM1647631.1 DUF2155 domain-containing protein [Sulfitobacter mediterraneus]MBM1651676.1 DUF2155 domain-containing protein [Sulfitobacter mediterraneus]
MLKYLAVLTCLAAPLAAQEVTSASGGVLRALDKVSGQTTDIDIGVGNAVRFGNLQIVMADCRYPAGNPSGNAYAALEISEAGKAGTLFSGWMIASAPALSALEHARYDVWVIRCTTS